jgi:hypothetical protein
MRRLNPKTAVKLLLAGLLLLAAAMPLSAQDEPSSPPPRDEQAAPAPVSHQNDVPVQQQDQDNDLPSLSFEKPTTNLATGTVLTTTKSPFRWGNLSVLSVDALQVFDSNYLFLKNNPISIQAGAVRALVVYAIKTGKSSFSIQYRPQVWASADATQFDYASHMLDFHTFRYLTSTWAFNISDQFSYVPDRGRLEQVGFSSDYTTSSSSQNPFLSTGQRLMTNSFGISADHSLTARDRMEFLVRHQYIRLSSANDGITNPAPLPTGVLTQQQTIGGEIGWTHTWRRDNEFGIKYAYDREYFQDFASTAQLNGVVFGFSRRLRPSLLLRVGGGPAFLQPAKPTGAVLSPATVRTYQASAALFKTFGRSGLTLSYARSNNFTGQITSNLNDRFDVTYSQHWNRRIDTTIGGAYVRQALTPSLLYGKSAWSEVDYRLSRSWSFYGTYSYLTQNGGGLPYGPRYLVTSGIRWSWDTEHEQRGGGFAK